MKRKLRLVIIAFSVSFLIMAGLSFYTMKQFETLTQYSDQIEHTSNVIAQVAIIEGVVKELDIKERGYMLTRDSAYITEINNNIKVVQPAFDKLRLLLEGDDEQSSRLRLTRGTLALRIDNIRQNMDNLPTDTTGNFMELFNKGKRLKLLCLEKLNEMKVQEQGLLVKSNKTKDDYQKLTSNAIRYLLFIFCIVTAGLFLLMINELKRRLSYQEELQNKIIDLKRSHSELEQIAYASSHDLQEPLRKIQVFTNRFSYLKKDGMDDETTETIGRINAAAMRMQELIDDLANLTTLTKNDEPKVTTNLNSVLNNALTDLNPKITAKDAAIHREVLPEIEGFPDQLNILFKALLDNALKFSRDDVKPLISVRSDKVNGSELADINNKLSEKSFFRITVSDNGIGFDNKFTSKMFQIFQRLHNQESEYEGKGIGLAICQRVMANHEGYIMAHGHAEVGATFKLYFPVNGN